MNAKRFAGAGAAIGAATAVTALLIGSTAASAAENNPESAFAISASGLLDITPRPFVESVDGSLQEDRLAGIDEDLLSVGLLTASAQDGAAESSVLDVNLRGILSAQLVRTFCADGDGGLELVNLNLLDGEFELTVPDGEPIRNETIDVSPLLKVTLGEQTRNADGSLTVTGIKVSVLPVTVPELDDPVTAEETDLLGGLLGTDLGDAAVLGDVLDELGLGTGETLQTITIGSATCDDAKGGNGDDGKDEDGKDEDGKDEDGKDEDKGVDKGEESSGSKDEDHCDDSTGDDSTGDDSGDDSDCDSGDTTAPVAGEAPAPTVVEASLPVTG